MRKTPTTLGASCVSINLAIRTNNYKSIGFFLKKNAVVIMIECAYGSAFILSMNLSMAYEVQVVWLTTWTAVAHQGVGKGNIFLILVCQTIILRRQEAVQLLPLPSSPFVSRLEYCVLAHPVSFCC